MKQSPRILYLSLAPRPVWEATDAVFQDIQYLLKHFKGEHLNLYPLKTPSSLFPSWLYGWHRLGKLRRSQSSVDINHILAPTLPRFPILSALQKPILYSLMTTLPQEISTRSISAMTNMSMITVNNEKDLQRLTSHGLERVRIVRPGINTAKLDYSQLELKHELHLLMASAPWESSQFHAKGIDLILSIMRSEADLRLTFLWRGSLEAEMQQRIQASGAADRIQLINQKVNISDIMKTVHGTVLLVSHPELVKAYPHSLMESLTCGKPVIVTKNLALSTEILHHQIGQVVPKFNSREFQLALQAFRASYKAMTQHLADLPNEYFDRQKGRKTYEKIYHEMISTT